MLREYADATKINTDEILSLVKRIQREGLPERRGKIEMWMEQITVLSSYAETTYQGTIDAASEYNYDHDGNPAPPSPRHERGDSIPIRGSHGRLDEQDTRRASAPPDRSSLGPPPKSASSPEVTHGQYQPARPSPPVAAEYPSQYKAPVTPFSDPQSKPPIRDVSSTKLERFSAGDDDASPTPQTELLAFPDASATDTPSPADSRDKAPMVSSHMVEISVKGIRDFAADVDTVVSRVGLDETVIQTSHRQRRRRSANYGHLLDSELLSLCANPARATIDRIRELVLRGADVNTWRSLDTVRWSNVRAMVLDLAVNNDLSTGCLIELLNNGAFTKTHGAQGLMFSPCLTVAAYRGNERAVWALCAAGAVLNPPDFSILCQQCSPESPGSLYPHHFFTAPACSTPLLAALQYYKDAIAPRVPTQSPSPAKLRARIVRFLLENGALANHTLCRKVSAEHLLHSPLTLAATEWSAADLDSQFSVLHALVLHGADVNYGFYPDGRPSLAAQAWPKARTYLWDLVARDRIASLDLLFQSGLRLRPDLFGVLLVWAARHSAWACLNFFAARINLAEVALLHKLVFSWADPAEVVRISTAQLHTANVLLVRAGASPSAAWSFSYWRRRSLLRKPVVRNETLSAVDLVDRIDADVSGTTRRLLIDAMRAEALAPGHGPIPPLASTDTAGG